MPLSFANTKNNNNSSFAANNNANMCKKTMNIATVRQTLAVMETALARASEYKRELHASAEQAQCDIRRAISNQYSAIREREHELLQEVHSLLANKKERLGEQMEQLNQSIGACKQLLELSNFDEFSSQHAIPADFLRRLSLSSRIVIEFGNGIVFEDTSAELCRNIAAFGKVYEEKLNDTCESIANWLTHQTGTNSSECNEMLVEDQQQFEFLRERVTSTSLSASSFDVIGATNSLPMENAFLQRQPNNAFATHFYELNCLPIGHWLDSSVPVVGNNNTLRNMPTIVSNPNEMLKKLHTDKGMIGSVTDSFVKNIHHHRQQRKQSCDLGLENSSLNWAYADFSSWLKLTTAAICVSSSSSTVINSILASPMEHWLAGTSASFVNIQNSNDQAVQLAKNLHKTPSTPTAHQLYNNGLHRFDTLTSSLLSVDEEKESEHPVEKEKLAENEFVDEYLTRMVRIYESNAMQIGKSDKIMKEQMKNEKSEQSRTLQNKADTNNRQKNQKCPLELPNDPSHWLKNYPLPKQNRPMNEMAEDLSCWESVLGWKGILEKIHASGEDVWLAPSSREIKIEE